MWVKKIFLFLILTIPGITLYSQLRPHHIFNNNMVLQREKPCKVWGWAQAGEKVKVEFGGQDKTSVATKEGEWIIWLNPMSANAKSQDLKITGKDSTILFTNVLVGDVWVLGGQSNMEFDLSRIFHGDAEVLSANFPFIRLMSVPRSANQLPVNDFKPINEYDDFNKRYEQKGSWFVCSPSTVKTFSGLGYIFGRRIFMASQVPVGLIDLSRGGTTIEAWVSPKGLSDQIENKELLNYWANTIKANNKEILKKSILKEENKLRKMQLIEPNPKPVETEADPASDPNYPGSSYNGMVAVIAGLAVKGIIFHHGYNNALMWNSRPRLYAKNFKTLISDWRNTFNDKELPFGIIELSAGGEPQTHDNFELRMVDAAPYIREGQFKAFLDLKNTGFVCTYDQQVNWYHPQKKVEAGERIARWALTTQYDLKLGWEPAVCEKIERLKDKIIVVFIKEVKSSDDRPFEGFSIAGSDRHFYPAKAAYLKTGQNEKGQPVYDKKRIEVWNNLTLDPVEVRYAWARNPLGNLVSSDDRIIPVPLFRSDKWDYPEAPFNADTDTKHRAEIKTLQKQAEDWMHMRIIREAEQVMKNHEPVK